MARDTEGPEERMATVVVTELQRQGYAVYQEVSTGYGGKRADIVARLGPIVTVVECKASLSLRLLDQLLGWRGQAHHIIGAYQAGRGRNTAVSEFCRHQGFGLWFAGVEGIEEVLAPRFNRTAHIAHTVACLSEAQRSGQYAAAGSKGAYFTPFRRTTDLLRSAVRDTPGITLREALGSIAHHYANARSGMSSLPDLIRKGLVPGVRLEPEGRVLRLFPVDAPERSRI